MSMLAEGKRKQKWSLNLRGSAWANDSSKFGEKLLRKMGWSEGQGLGAQKQGITEHIKVRVKHDGKGLGFKQNDQVWVEVENDFSNLLSKLSSQNEKAASETSSSELHEEGVNTVNRSLEEQSKKSKARVHYQKFTRGKDLSRYSKKDLECIFGVSSKSLETKHEENKNFVTSGNMEEYFSNKKESKHSKLNLEDGITAIDEIDQVKLNDNETSDLPRKKKKKGKKRKHADVENIDRVIVEEEVMHERSDTGNEIKSFCEEDTEKLTKKRRKNVELPKPEGNREEEAEVIVKKKHKKKSKLKSEIPQVDGMYDSSEVEELINEPTSYCDTSVLNSSSKDQDKDTFKKNKKPLEMSNYNIKTSRKITLKKKECMLENVKNVLNPTGFIKDDANLNLNEKNEEMSKKVEAIVQAKINNYLSQVFNRNEKFTNPAREMKEKKKKMIQDDANCVQFNGSNLSSISGYVCY